MSEEKEADENIEIANKMMKAAGKVTARQLSKAALICIQLAVLTSDNEPTIQEQVGQSELTGVLEAACQECGGTDTEWHCSQYTNSGVENGRLRLHEVGTRFFLGCNSCSATIRTISGDKLARLMTEAANAELSRAGTDFKQNPYA